MADKPIVKHFRSGASNLIAWFCDQFGLVEHINHAVDWDSNHWKVSPGQHVQALIINTLCGRDPLSHVMHFFETQDTEVLFGKGITAHDFNDDALGRTLDRLHAAGPKKLLTSLTLRHLVKSNEPLWFAHADTTSKSFYGAYEPKLEQAGLTEPSFTLARGYSKDNKPDLKQMVIGMMTVGGGMPLFADVRSGNLDDKTWNHEMIDTIVSELEAEQLHNLVYIADSAFFTKPNVLSAAEQQMRFISLVSDNHALREAAIEQVIASPALEAIGPLSDEPKASSYRIQEIRETFHGLALRLLVVQSTHLFEQKKATFERRLATDKDNLEKAREVIEKRDFACEHDAREAWKVWQHAERKSLYPLVAHYVTETRRATRSGRGRPKKGEEPLMETVHKVKVDIQPVPENVITEAEKRMGYFVLATNVMDEQLLPARKILSEYKEQSSVEMRFKFLKDPQFVDALFLKTPSRIEALGYVLLMALFIYMTFEKRLRLALETKEIRLQPSRGRYTSKPTARVVLQMLNVYVSTLCWYDKDEGVWHRDLDRDHEEVKLVFELLQFDRSYYTTVRERK